MIDLHSHFLPGVDDGAKDIEVTREMLRQAVSAGITRLLATPHINEHTTPAVEQHIQETYSLVQEEIASEGLPVRLDLSAEIRFDPALFNWIDHEWLIIGHAKRYVIFELPIQGLPLNLTDHLFNLQMKGITPIIAHPERNIVFQNQKEKLFTQLGQDCVIQINAGSVIGQFGPGARQLAFALLRQQRVHLVCSDAHETKHRNYNVLRQAYEVISRDFGFAVADLLCIENPERILEGGETAAAQKENEANPFKSILKKFINVGK